MKFLLVTDLDNTLVGHKLALQTLNDRLAAMRNQVYLVYATGRSYSSTCQLMAEVGLLQPDYCIAGVGSEIYQGNAPDTTWMAQLSENWERETICEIARQFPELAPQPASEQNPWKISFFLNPAAPEATIAELEMRLRQAGLAAQVVFSSGRDVDILPQFSNKGNATAYLQKRLEVHRETTLVCGDSGNDISLFEAPARGVIVSNAQPELLDWYRNFGQPHHYLAQRPCAAGILEAIEYFELLP
jgi:sucrose-6F-phosphate phosphohydrolase